MEDPCGRNEINGANKNKRKAEDSQKTARKNRKAEGPKEKAGNEINGANDNKKDEKEEKKEEEYFPSEKEIALYVKYGFTRENAILTSIIDHKRKTRN